MKLLIYSHAFAPQVGGIETFSMYLARGLAGFVSSDYPETIEVTLVTQTPGIDPSPAGEPFHIVRRPSIWSLWRLVGAMDKVLLAGPAIAPLLFALIRRKVIVLTHHGYQSICPNGMLFQFPTENICPGHFAARQYLKCVNCNAPQEGLARSIRLLVLTFVRRFLSRLADSNVAVSEHVSRRIVLPHSTVIRNGVPEPVSPSEALHLHITQPRCFAYVGRLITEKGVPILIEAAGILKRRGREFEILIIGDGPQRAALQAKVSSLGLDREVVFLGFLMGAQREKATGKASALVMPSICEDAAPFSILEQMMQGKLVIGSKLGGLAEEIGDCGLTFAAGDAVALADQMERVIAQPDLITSLGQKARDRARQSYGLRRMLYEYRALLNTR